MTPEGEPDLKGVRFAPMSTFGPYVDELLIPQIKEAIDRYDIDGAWIDGDNWCAREGEQPPQAGSGTRWM